jgi:thiamine biosynthesis protein ThiS
VTQLTLIVNGDQRTVSGPATLIDLLSQLRLDPRMVVVELNREIVRRQFLSDRQLKDGDSVELVHFVGGG